MENGFILEALKIVSKRSKLSQFVFSAFTQASVVLIKVVYFSVSCDDVWMA